MPYRYVRKNTEFEKLCRDLRSARRIAVDTEFVAENSYLPQLCLIQLSLDDQLLVVDPLAVDGVQRFWEALVETDGEVILHAGRGELEFCYRAVRKFPRRIFDVQIAAGMTGHEYPAGYANLVSKLLDEKAGRHETRTDWRRRPLTDRQIEYALDDVRYLPRMRDVLHLKLVEWNREAWLQEEIDRRNAEIVKHYRGTDRWRISGNRSLSRRGLAIVRELWKWREERAARLNR
ncbi:MAG: ribonuclease D, partial [Planctomycetota bacterium]